MLLAALIGSVRSAKHGFFARDTTTNTTASLGYFGAVGKPQGPHLELGIGNSTPILIADPDSLELRTGTRNVEISTISSSDGTSALELVDAGLHTKHAIMNSDGLRWSNDECSLYLV